jgi:hypothetical protein
MYRLVIHKISLGVTDLLDEHDNCILLQDTKIIVYAIDLYIYIYIYIYICTHE